METTETGVTAFAPPPAPQYRFSITASAEKIRITLEDCKSKLQWSTGFLEHKDFLASTSKISNATVSDYIKVFKDALEYSPDGLVANDNDAERNKSSDAVNDSGRVQSQVKTSDAGKLRRKLTLGNGSIQLELTVKIRVLTSAWNAQYRFKLEPITRERIDVMAAKLKDAEEQLAETKRSLAEEKDVVAELKCEVHSLTARVAALEKERKPTLAVHVKAFTNRVPYVTAMGQISWLAVVANVAHFTWSALDGIRFLVAGWYTISSTVSLTAINSNTTVELHVNNVCVQRLNVPDVGNQSSSVSISCCVYILKNQNVTLVASGTSRHLAANFFALKVHD